LIVALHRHWSMNVRFPSFHVPLTGSAGSVHVVFAFEYAFHRIQNICCRLYLAGTQDIGSGDPMHVARVHTHVPGFKSTPRSTAVSTHLFPFLTQSPSSTQSHIFLYKLDSEVCRLMLLQEIWWRSKVTGSGSVTVRIHKNNDNNLPSFEELNC